MQLDPDLAEWQALAATVVDYLTGVLRDLPDAPASAFDGVDELIADPALRRPPPETGRPVAELLDVLDRAASVGLNTSHPGYLAFIPGSGLVSAGLAGLIGDVLNRYTGLAFPAPALVALEADVLRWLSELFALPTTAGGLFTSGGSLATFSALVTARHDRLPEDFLRGTLYVTDQAHLSVLKAARLAGFPPSAVRIVPDDGAQRMDVAALRELVARDPQPFCVVANAGTTNTGAIDPLDAIADLCAREGLWLHVDGAYGAAFQLTERGRRRLRGIERADSITLDPHKGFFLPFGTGCLLVRDTAPLRAAHSGDDAHYLQDIDAAELPDFADLGPELTREFRGLRVWLPLHLHGVAAFRAAIDEKHDLADHLRAELAKIETLELLPSDLTVVVFRSADSEQLLKSINDSGRFFLSSTRLGGRFTLRVCVLSHRTHREHVDEFIELVRRLA
jgi:aromatic-L-amino-acid decarboxylase